MSAGLAGYVVFFCRLCGAFLLFVRDLACDMGFVCRHYLFRSLRVTGQKYPDGSPANKGSSILAVFWEFLAFAPEARGKNAQK